MPAEHPEHRTDADRTEDESDASSVDRLIGVYDADGTLTGELRYWFEPSTLFALRHHPWAGQREIRLA